MKMAKGRQTFIDRIQQKLGTTPIVLLDTEDRKNLSDKEELLKTLLDIRNIRTEHKQFYERRINALNPMVGDYREKAAKLRSDVLNMTRKINLIDDVIDFINKK
jgi:hypothetical protein